MENTQKKIALQVLMMITTPKLADKAEKMLENFWLKTLNFAVKLTQSFVKLLFQRRNKKFKPKQIFALVFY